MKRVLVAALTGTAVATSLAACSTSAPIAPTAPADQLPPRPREIRMGGLDPCTLVTPEMLAQAGVPAKPRGPATQAEGVRDCSWERSVLQRPSGGLGIAVVTSQDVRNVLSVPGAKITTVAGFGAVEIPISKYGAETNCDVRVDVAPGQGLWVSWFNTLGDEPGATHELMCERAHRAAEGVMQQLLATSK